MDIPTAISATPMNVLVCTAGEASGVADALCVGDGEGDADTVADAVGELVGEGVGDSLGDGVGEGVGDAVGGGGALVRGGTVGVGVATVRWTLTTPCICGWMPQM